MDWIGATGALFAPVRKMGNKCERFIGNGRGSRNIPIADYRAIA